MWSSYNVYVNAYNVFSGLCAPFIISVKNAHNTIYTYNTVYNKVYKMLSEGLPGRRQKSGPKPRGMALFLELNVRKRTIQSHPYTLCSS